MNFKKSLILVIVFLCSSTFFYCNSNHSSYSYLINSNDDDFKKLWKTADSLIEKGLTKSALDAVGKIYTKAVKEDNAPQLIKTVMYKVRLTSQMEESFLEKSIAELNQELKISKFPATPVLHSITASLYWQYYQNNRWKILDRSTGVNGKPEDLSTWNRQQLMSACLHHYLESLENAEQSKTLKIDFYDEIINKGSVAGRKLRPTFYDFLAHRAIDFFTGAEASWESNEADFDFNKNELFLPVKDFIKNKLSANSDSLNIQYVTLSLIKELLMFHEKDNSPDALIENDLLRLDYVYSNCSSEFKDSLYEAALENIQQNYSKNDIAQEAGIRVAKLHLKKSEWFKPLVSDDFKWEKKHALEILEKIVLKYPGSYAAQLANPLINVIKKSEFSIVSEEVNEPGKPARMLVTHRNTSQLFFRIIKVDDDVNKEKFQQLASDKLIKYYLNQKSIFTFNQLLPSDKDFNSHRVELKIPALEMGNYVLLASPSSEFDAGKELIAYCNLVYTNIAYMQRNEQNGTISFYMVHRFNGKPISSVSAEVFKQNYDYTSRKYIREKIGVFKTSKNSTISIPVPENENYTTSYYIKFINGNDKYAPEQTFYSSRINESPDQTDKSHFFLDRKIYRPGQTIYFKVIRTRGKDSASKVVSFAPVQLKLIDVNNQVVSSMLLKTNDFGSAAGSFVLPLNCLNGSFSLSDGFGETYLMVEEYKRPKFEVKFDEVKKAYQLNDEIKLSAKAIAFAGYPIQNAKVKFKVSRSIQFPYWQYRFCGDPFWKEQKEIAHGMVTTNTQGEFTIPFLAVEALSMSKSATPNYVFEVSADVTDENGETHSAHFNLYLNKKALQIHLNTAEEINKDEPDSLHISVKNNSGVEQQSTGKIQLYSLMQASKVFRSSIWEQPDQYLIKKEEYYSLFPNDLYEDETNKFNWKKDKLIQTFSFNTAISNSIDWKNELTKLNPGVYLLEAFTKDAKGNEVSDKKYITVYSLNAKTQPDFSVNWFKSDRQILEVGEKFTYIQSSALPETDYLVEIENKGKIVFSEYRKTAFEKFSFPITENYRGNFTVHVNFIKNNRFYSNTQLITVPYSNKDLKIKLETFRNKIKPGQKEEWKIQITNPNNKFEPSELLVSMYDASLDVFSKNDWMFNVFEKDYTRLNLNSNVGYEKYCYYFTNRKEKQFSFKERTFDRLNAFGYYGFETVSRNLLSASFNDFRNDDEGKVLEMEFAPQLKSSGISKDKLRKSSDDKNEKSTENKPRTNFNETAFFYPQLKTDANGNVSFSFIAPESLTKWRLQAFAHTSDLKSKIISEEIITQKELMIEANAPRFFRESDEMEFTAKIINLSNNECSGTAKLVLKDALNQSANLSSLITTTKEISFSLPKNESKVVSWKIAIPKHLKAITYQLTATTNQFSDAEENTIPILSNQELITESMSVFINGNQQKEMKFEKLINQNNSSTTLKNHRLTFEFTSQPIWNAIQALPSLMELSSECSEQLFNRYYANSLGFHIINANPKIKQVVEQWKLLSPEAFNSNLQKNQELKSLLLQETPWLIAANNEQENKKRLALYFDANTMTQELKSSLLKLSNMQLPNGAWPWFDGGLDDQYITQYIVSGLGHLDKLGIISLRLDANAWQLLQRAVMYTDDRLIEEFENIKKIDNNWKKNNHLSVNFIQYLYARSFFKDIKQSEQVSEAINYLKEQCNTFWTKNNRYLQAMIALTAKRMNNEQLAKDILKSIKENSLKNEEMGIYWKENYDDYHWYESVNEMQALMVELFTEMNEDKSTINELRKFLLKSKQTQNWNTSRATSDAIYALLLNNQSELNSEPKLEIQLGEEKLTNEIKAEAGTGYIKKVWNSNEIKPELGKLKIKRKGEGISWGALHWQYFEDINKVSSHTGPLSVVKNLYVEQINKMGKKTIQVDNNTELKPGDKLIVRLTVKTDRDLDYVHLKDLRAACFEPTQTISSYQWQNQVGFYQSTKDASTNFYFNHLNKGIYVFEYTLVATHAGKYSNGFAKIQSFYAPELNSHSEGVSVEVKK
jgi:uncharacterized protein YfaS (alpha-2-macroglobulin family)